MKIGIKYKTDLEEIAVLVWSLRDSAIKADLRADGIFEERYNGKVFELTLGENCFRFSTVDEALLECDKKVRVSHHSFDDVDPRYDKEICILHDVIRDEFTEDHIREFLDKGNILISVSTANFSHENLIYDPLLGLVTIYLDLGLHFLNYYQAPKNFKRLLGVYHKPLHIGGAPNNRRNELYDKVKAQLGDDFGAYKSCDSSFFDLINSYRYFGRWGNNHITGYTDYVTSVCNIVFETYDSVGSNVFQGRTLLTEKTTKAIIFCEENIFFIWYGREDFYKVLREYGFWFLNSEFYDATTEIQDQTAMCQSVFNATTYLQKLKHSLGTNERVYSHLMEKYGHHLKENVRLFKHLEQNCPVKDTLINTILK